MAWDAPGFKDPELGYPLAGYLILLARYGIYIVENLALDDLAASGHQRFDFICSLLKPVGATGSPVSRWRSLQNSSLMPVYSFSHPASSVCWPRVGGGQRIGNRSPSTSSGEASISRAPADG
jgi:hypothetical protein